MKLISLNSTLWILIASVAHLSTAIGDEVGPAKKSAKKLTLERYVVPDVVSNQLIGVSVKDVEVQGELGRRIGLTADSNIKALDFDKAFCGHFRKKTGPEVVGAFVGMGMLIDACVRLARHSQDPEMISIKDDLIDTIIDAQLENGYSGFYKPERRLWNHTGRGGDNWDIHEMAFIIDGLVTDYQLFGSQRSLDAAIKTADFIIGHWHEMPANYAAKVDMHVLCTGIDWAILKLYKVTGQRRFLEFSKRLKSLYDWKTGIVIGRRPGVSGHMFAYFAMCVAQLELYRLTGDEELLGQTKQALQFFLAGDGLTITGSAGQREIWTDDQDGEGHLGETCATAYQIRVYENLLRLTGKSMYGDLIERTVFNGMLGAQSPDGKSLRYFTPFEGPREYYPHQHMCCPGNFRRIVSELPGMILYTTADDGVAVNLYTQSAATVQLNGGMSIRLDQETDYPNSGTVVIAISPEHSVAFPVSLRIPAWAGEAKVMVNDSVWRNDAHAGSFLTIDRKWSAGDKVKLELPMEFRFIKGRKRNAGRVALMRGPLIFGLNLEANPEASADGTRTLHDLGKILIDPASVTGPENDDSVRPGGIAAFIGAWREDHSGKADREHEFRLKLTEFPDPKCQQIYFKVPDYSVQVDDELLVEQGTTFSIVE